MAHRGQDLARGLVVASAGESLVHGGGEHRCGHAHVDGRLRRPSSLPRVTHPSFVGRGSVIGSWLLDLTAGALAHDPHLDAYEGRVSDSGEGRWTAQAAIDVGVPAAVLTAAVHQRFSSRGNDETAGKVLSAMRHAFGGHLEKSAEGEA